MDTAQYLTDLRAQRDCIDSAIAALEALGGTIVPAKTAAKPAVVKSAKSSPVVQAAAKRVVSPEARQRMADAQQKRWAKKKRVVKAAAKKAAVAPAAKKPAKVATKKVASKSANGGITAAGRKKMSEAAKARWATKKNAKPAENPAKA
jgi:hypothetical protein